VLVIDNHPIVRAGLRRVIDKEDDLQVCAEADTARDARTAIKDRHPDVIIADIGLNQGDGIELVRDVRAHYSRLPILVGANGYIMKQASSEQILLSLRRVLNGDIYVSEDVGLSMIRKSAGRGAYYPPNPIDRLSNRELQILHLVGRGMSTKDTARTLNLSVKTIESHRQRIKHKLQLTTGSQLLQYAINWFTGQESGANGSW
jgi:DNA-binding NarL/FixJ family response regulator